jgi:hypothetical protein
VSKEREEVSGLIVRVGAALVVCAALSAAATADPVPIVPLNIPSSSPEGPVVPPFPDLSATPVGEALPTPVASQTTGTAIPLPPGVVFGLVGLASAAIARHRYLKRH